MRNGCDYIIKTALVVTAATVIVDVCATVMVIACGFIVKAEVVMFVVVVLLSTAHSRCLYCRVVVVVVVLR